MNKRQGHVVVTTEVAMCSFCGRPRTLRSEHHQLGTLVRTIVTCETCHRTLSSAMSVASIEPAPPEPDAHEHAAIEPEPVQEPAPAAGPLETQSAKPAVKSGVQRKRGASATAAKRTASKRQNQKKTRCPAPRWRSSASRRRSEPTMCFAASR